MTDLRDYIAKNFEHDIPVASMAKNSAFLLDPEGRMFQEVNSNIWMQPHANAAYLGTSRHGGGMVLRLMFVKIDDEWINATTGREATVNQSEFI